MSQRGVVDGDEAMCPEIKTLFFARVPPFVSADEIKRCADERIWACGAHKPIQEVGNCQVKQGIDSAHEITNDALHYQC